MKSAFLDADMVCVLVYTQNAPKPQKRPLKSHYVAIVVVMKLFHEAYTEELSNLDNLGVLGDLIFTAADPYCRRFVSRLCFQTAPSQITLLGHVFTCSACKAGLFLSSEPN